MTRSKRSPAAMRSTPLIPFLVLLAGCAAGAAGGPRGYVHEYEATGEEPVRYEMVSDIGMTMEQPMPMDMGAVMTIELSVSVSGERAARAATLSVDEFAAEFTGALAEQAGLVNSTPLAGLMEMKGKTERFDLDPRGKVIGKPDLTDIAAGPTAAGLLNYAQLMFIPWPESSMTPGLAWTDTVTMSAQEEIAFDMRTVNRYEYLGLQDVDVDGTMLSLHAVKRISDTAMTGGAEMEGMTMDMVVTSNGAGTLYFDPNGGMLRNATVDESMSMTMTMIGPMDMTIPMEMNYRTVVRRLP